MPDDDPRARQRAMPAANAAVVRLMGTDLLTVRVDLNRESGDQQARPQRKRRAPAKAKPSDASTAPAAMQQAPQAVDEGH